MYVYKKRIGAPCTYSRFVPSHTRAGTRWSSFLYEMAAQVLIWTRVAVVYLGRSWYHACTKQSSTWSIGALFLNKVIALNGTYTEYKTIFMEKKVVRSTIYNGACLPGLSLFRVSHTRLRWPLSLTVGHWSGRIPSAGGKGGSASFLRLTAPRQHVPICGTRRSLWPSSGAAGPTPPARRFRPPPLT